MVSKLFFYALPLLPCLFYQCGVLADENKVILESEEFLERKVKDPTRPLRFKEGEKRSVGTPVVSSIITGSVQPMAIINGELITVGASVAGYQLSSIDSDKVFMDKSGKTIELRLE